MKEDEKMSGEESMYMERKTGERIFTNKYVDSINDAMHELHVLRVEEAKINASISEMVDEISMDFKRFIESVKIGDKVDVLPSIDDRIRSGVVVETGRELMESYFILSTEHGIIIIPLILNFQSHLQPYSSLFLQGCTNSCNILYHSSSSPHQTLRTFDCLYNFSSSSVRLRPFLSFSRILLILIALISGFISFKRTISLTSFLCLCPYN